MVIPAKVTGVRYLVSKKDGGTNTVFDCLIEGRYIVEAVVWGQRINLPDLSEIELTPIWRKEGYRNVVDFRVPAYETPRKAAA